MFILDSDHLSILQSQRGPEFQHLANRCSRYPACSFYVSIVSFHEQFNGWVKWISRAKDPTLLVRGYSELEAVVGNFSRTQTLSFDQSASDQFERLRGCKLRIGTMDMRIASIAIAYDMILLTRNTVDFERVPSLRIEDWTLPSERM